MFQQGTELAESPAKRGRVLKPVENKANAASPATTGKRGRATADKPAELKPEAPAKKAKGKSSKDVKETIDDHFDWTCGKCQDTGNDMVICEGTCFRAFHLGCAGLEKIPTEFKCVECTDNVHSCFHCGKKDAETMKCSVKECGNPLRSLHP